jgi:hypothetical protein
MFKKRETPPKEPPAQSTDVLMFKDAKLPLYPVNVDKLPLLTVSPPLQFTTEEL